MLVSPTPKRNDFGLNYWTIFLIKNPSRGVYWFVKGQEIALFPTDPVGIKITMSR
jgi:hypothetical protein